MTAPSPAEQALRAGDAAQALALLQEQVRAKPGDPKLRVFLFQLLALLGQWERAVAQLDVAGQLDAGALAMVAMYRDAVQCERLRARVFAGQTSPLLFGEPEQWLALLIESLLVSGRGREREAAQLRAEAFEAAPPSAGTADGASFEWIADADSRLGPVLEAVINGRYYWVPFVRLARLTTEAPTDLRDVIWLPAHLQFSNGGETMALLPARYPGSEASEDGAIVLARKTIWTEPEPDTFHGLGQRLLATDRGELALLDLRELSIGAAPEAGA
jgi:type VI secretion system protein ImpE